MSETSKANGLSLAYPHTEYDQYEKIYGEHAGMTKREVIAMHLEAALISGSMADGTPIGADSPKALAEASVKFADALLEALS